MMYWMVELGADTLIGGAGNDVLGGAYGSADWNGGIWATPMREDWAMIRCGGRIMGIFTSLI